MKIDNNLILIDKIKNNLNLEEKVNLNKNDSKDNNLLKGESPAVVAGAKIIQENGYSLDKEDINNLREFFSGDKKDIPSKLSALKVAMEKEIPLKDNLLSKIQVNTDISMLDFLSDSQKTATKSKKTMEDKTRHHKNDLSTIIEKNEKLLKDIFTIIDKNLEEDDKYIIKEEKKKNELSTLNPEKKTARDSSIDTLKESIVDKIANDIRALLSEESGNDIEDNKNNLDDISKYLNAVDNINKAFAVNQLLEVKITQKLIDLKNDFSSLKKELTVNIYKVSDETNNLSKEDRINLLYESIENLDNKIMKSEMSLYMDLKGEKKLIEISSKLQIAKKHIENGEIKKAELIFKDAKKSLDELKFEPSIKKAFAIVHTDTEDVDFDKIKLDKWIKNAMQNFASSEKSVSSLINYLRKMGMNHDVEQFQEMQGSKEHLKQGEFKNLVNLKEILLKMSQDGGEGKNHTKSSAIIEHIEGGQLKNKILDNKMPQSMELNLPIELDGRIKNVKVFIKSPQKMLKLDWENFDMYFVLNSDKLGQMGIRVQAVQRQLSVKIINDKVENISKDKELNDGFKKELENFGYHLVKMLMEAWDNDENKNLKDTTSEQKLSEKAFIHKSKGGIRFDIKI